MQECSVCQMGRTTWDLTEEEVAKLVTEVERLSEVDCSPAKLPSVVPMVSLKDPASYDSSEDVRVWDNTGTLPDTLFLMVLQSLQKESWTGYTTIGMMTPSKFV